MLFVQKFSVIYQEMQVMSCDTGDVKQGCPVLFAPHRTFWPRTKPLELRGVSHPAVSYLTVITQKVLLKSILKERHMIDQLNYCINPLKWLQKN